MTPTAYSVGSMNSIFPTNGDGNFTFDRSSTATRVNKEGLIETVAIDTPRLDYPLIDGVVQSEPALLLEPSRTNLLTYSEDFSNWTNANSTDSSNQIISPDGTQNADKVITNNGSINGQVQQTVSKSGVATTYTYSVFAKKGEWNESLRLYITDTSFLWQ